MIRHRIGVELARRVAAEAPDWIAAAARASEHYQRYGMALASNRAVAGESEADRDARRLAAVRCRKRVRAILRDLQQGKCAFCEQDLPAGEPGLGHFHLEHYRPIEGAKQWKTDAYTGAPIPRQWQRLQGRSYHDSRKWVPGDGYPWLEFSLDNVCACCGVCNVALKKNSFPIAGTPGQRDAAVEDLDAIERPLLLRPVGDDDRLDPARYITFDGYIARPLHSEGHPDHLPGAVTIRLLGLVGLDRHDERREELREELIKARCMALMNARSALQRREEAADDDTRDAASAILEALCGDGGPQAACVRAMVASFERDPVATYKVMADVEVRYRQLLGVR